LLKIERGVIRTRMKVGSSRVPDSEGNSAPYNKEWLVAL